MPIGYITVAFENRGQAYRCSLFMCENSDASLSHTWPWSMPLLCSARASFCVCERVFLNMFPTSFIRLTCRGIQPCNATQHMYKSFFLWYSSSSASSTGTGVMLNISVFLWLGILGIPFHYNPDLEYCSEMAKPSGPLRSTMNSILMIMLEDCSLCRPRRVVFKP